MEGAEEGGHHLVEEVAHQQQEEVQLEEEVVLRVGLGVQAERLVGLGVQVGRLVEEELVEQVEDRKEAVEEQLEAGNLILALFVDLMVDVHQMDLV